MRHFFLKSAAGFPVACIASAIRQSNGALTDGPLEPDSSIVFSISIHNPLDIYNRARARDIAYARLSKGNYTDIGAVRPIKYAILSIVAAGGRLNGKRLRSRVVNAARFWLDQFEAAARVRASIPVGGGVQPETIDLGGGITISESADHSHVDEYSQPEPATFTVEGSLSNEPEADTLADAVAPIEVADPEQARIGIVLDRIFDDHPPEAEKPWRWSDGDVIED